jgi:hypothetical protein
MRLGGGFVRNRTARARGPGGSLQGCRADPGTLRRAVADPGETDGAPYRACVRLAHVTARCADTRRLRGSDAP